MTKVQIPADNAVFRKSIQARLSQPSRFITGLLILASAVSLSRAGTINWSGAGDGASWGSTSNWVGGVLPGTDDDVVIPDVTGTPTVTFANVTGTVVVKSVTASEALSVTGGSLRAINGISTSSTFTLSGGTLLNTSLAATGSGVLTLSGGTLDNVTIASAASSSGTLSVRNGLTFASNAKVTLNGVMNFSGTQTLGGTGEIFLKAGSTCQIQSVGGGSIGTASVLTIGANITIDGPGNLYVQNYYNTDSTINLGTITASASGQALYFNYGTFTNQGTLGVSGGSSLNLSNAWTNSGTISINASTVNLGGTFTPAGLGTFSRTGGTVNITGTVTNTGTTFTATTNTGTLFLTSGSITGGTIATSGSGVFSLTGGTIDGVTISSPVAVSGTVSVRNGLTLSSAKVTLGGTMNFSGTQTLGGTGEIFCASGTTSQFQTVGGGSLATAAVLTIGANITIDGPGNLYVQNYYNTDSTINLGTITASASGQALYFNYGTFTNQGTLGVSGGSSLNLNNAWTNSGTISVNASTVNLGGTFSATSLGNFNRTGGTINITGNIANTGTTLALNANTGSLFLTSGTITGGTITTAGGAAFTATNGTLDAVTLASPAAFSGSVTVRNGLTLSSNIKVTLSGALNFSGTQTLGGTGEIFFASGTTSQIQSVGGGSLATAATLTIGANITIDGPGNGYLSNYYANDMIENLGTIIAGSSGQGIWFYTGTFTNKGTIKAQAGGAVYFTNAWSNTGTFFLNGGTFNLGGTFSAAGMGTFNRTGGTVNITGTVANTGTTLTATANTGPLILTSGTITGGTIATSGGATFTASGGILDAVSIASPISTSSAVTVRNGLTLVSNVKVTVAGILNFTGTQTLGGTGEIYMSSGTTSLIQSSGGGSVATASVLTIGPNVTIDGPGDFYIQNYYNTDSTINKGTVVAGTSNQSVYFNYGQFTNEGTVKALNGGIVNLNGAWSNTGILQVNGGTLNLGGTFTSADIGTINRTGGTVKITGNLTNTGSTLALTASTGDIVFQSGKILGGDITTSGGAVLLMTGGTLDGVTLSGTATVPSGSVAVGNDLILAGGTLNLSGGNVYFYGTQTLGGTGQVNFGPSFGPTIYSVGTGSPGGAAVLTIGPNVSIGGTQNPRFQSYYSGDSVSSFAKIAWTSARFVNISTRAVVGTGADILIPGFVVAGSGTETLLIRAAGPALTPFGVDDVLAVPTLTLFDGKGNPIATNTGWGTNADPAQVSTLAAKVGAFAFPSGSADCALVAVLPAGAYTVQVSGVGGTTGVALAEVYEVSSTGPRLTNISTRAQVGTGGNIIIPGFVIRGPGTEKLLVRAVGPGLDFFGVTGFLVRPSINFIDGGGHLLASNTGWETNATPSLVTAAAASIGAFPLKAGEADSAIVATLTAGTYTFQVLGVNLTTGNALAEVYELP